MVVLVNGRVWEEVWGGGEYKIRRKIILANPTPNDSLRGSTGNILAPDVIAARRGVSLWALSRLEA